MADNTHTTPYRRFEDPLADLKSATDTINLLRLATTNRPEISNELNAVYATLRKCHEDLGRLVWQTMADSPAPSEIDALRDENKSLKVELEIFYAHSDIEVRERAWVILCNAARHVLREAETNGMLDVS